MRLFKCSGGMTRGRGITDSTISSFVNVMPRCIPICSFLEDFTGVTKLSSEQHKDLCPSNISCDLKDFKILFELVPDPFPISLQANSISCLPIYWNCCLR